MQYIMYRPTSGFVDDVGFSHTDNDAYFAFAVVTGYMTEEVCYPLLLCSFVQLLVLNYNEI